MDVVACNGCVSLQKYIHTYLTDERLGYDKQALEIAKLTYLLFNIGEDG